MAVKMVKEKINVEQDYLEASRGMGIVEKICCFEV